MYSTVCGNASAQLLALFSLAKDSNLRGCDLVEIGVDELPLVEMTSSERPAEKDRPASAVRADRADPTSII
jgi:hypothetical protein